MLRKAVEIDHRTPVLVLTATVDAGCCLNALNLGANEYVQKPLTPSEVQTLVDEYLRPSVGLTAANAELVFHARQAGAEPWCKAS